MKLLMDNTFIVYELNAYFVVLITHLTTYMLVLLLSCRLLPVSNVLYLFLLWTLQVASFT